MRQLARASFPEPQVRAAGAGPEAPQGWNVAGGPIGRAAPTGAARTGAEPAGAPVADRVVAQVARTSVNLHVGDGAGAAPSAWSPVVWGPGDLQRFSGTPTGLTRYGGNIQTAQVGVDLYSGPAALGGVAYLRSWGAVDYTGAGFDGVLDPRLHTVHPYLYWQPHDRISAWGLGGLGGGQVGVTEEGRRLDAPATFQMVAGGVRAGLVTRGATEVGLRADVFAATLGTRAAADIAAVDGDARRGRVMLELAHDRSLAAGRSLRVQVEVGGRVDDGDADQGAGVETGARIGFLDAGSGLDVAVHGRVLLVHESDYRDWGVRVQASWDPGRQARGDGPDGAGGPRRDRRGPDPHGQRGGLRPARVRRPVDPLQPAAAGRPRPGAARGHDVEPADGRPTATPGRRGRAAAGRPPPRDAHDGRGGAAGDGVLSGVRGTRRAAMPRSDDTVSPFRRPRECARTLGAMAAEQVGPRVRLPTPAGRYGRIDSV